MWDNLGLSGKKLRTAPVRFNNVPQTPGAAVCKVWAAGVVFDVTEDNLKPGHAIPPTLNSTPAKKDLMSRHVTY